ncbi:NAD(P)/FAD-dependent oxidoreductase [Arthrobacter sp. ISL-28]|uniref:flavin-containing monooxygenase n=1 Tax=Arthrobacter sp. ISL-28 TaxID=2819108 RepID=UPI001BEA3CC7|nr:NAD(P)/FAD-dependent oxidoreductase [Arthrobacter sp. ISL-28]MBT2523366.1 NAD(P)/FAD-dependent oxidoreductase [Arthrobacter sp. ISL-28]
MAFSSEQSGSTDIATITVDAVVVGAGFSGLYMTHRLKHHGLTVVGIDAGSDVGGTWHWNKYPGVRTDSEASFYAYTLNEEMSQHDWDYSEKFPPGHEVESYLKRVADRFDLRGNYRFSTTVVSADYSESDKRWMIRTDDGGRLEAKYFISAAGILSAPIDPGYPGIDSFRGTAIHASRWPEGGIECRGKRVAVVGTGSTGVQLVPALAESAESVVVFQRTPNYVLPSPNEALGGGAQTMRHDGLAGTRHGIRESSLGMPYTSSGRLAMDVSDEEREAVFEEGWANGGFRFLVETFDDLWVNPDANYAAAEFIRNKIRGIVKDPKTAELLCPDYPYGVKRPAQGIEFYEAFNRDNVHLVDIKSAPITDITPDGIRTTGGKYDVDVIIFAVGYDAAGGAVTRMNVTGRGGVRLDDKWAEGLRTYLGMTVSGFPNFFMILGPQAPTGNMPSVSEGQGDWIARIIAEAEANGANEIEALESAEDDWSQHVSEVANMTLVPQGSKVNSWFVGANVKGKAESIVIYLGGYKPFFDRSDQVADAGFEGLKIS